MGGCKSNPGYLAVENQTSRMPNENQSNEERFARPDQQAYSGWSSLAIIAIVIGIFFLMFLRH